MARYVIEIGLDCSVAARHDGTYPHLISLAQVTNWDDKTGKPWWFTNLKPNDEFVFRACDYTQGATLDSPKVDVKSLVVRFLEPADPTRLSPCLQDNPLICSGKEYYPIFGCESLLIQGAPGWRFGTGNTDKVFTFGTAARALLRMSVAATHLPVEPLEKLAEELRWFTHDPEIFVGEGGPPHGSYKRSRALKRR